MRTRDDGVIIVEPKSRAEWRAWLSKNYDKYKSAWLVLHKKNSPTPNLNIVGAIKEALCFGWVDSKTNRKDDISYFAFFAKRNPKSNWSAINKATVQRLIDANQMAAPGYEMIQVAKQSGTWDALNDVDNLVIPPDLQDAFQEYPGSRQFWDEFSRSVRRGILEWIFNAKRPETRAKRIIETASRAAQNQAANQWPRK